MTSRVSILAFLLILFTGSEGSGQFSTHYYLQKSVFESLPDEEEGEIIFLGNSITAGGHWSELFNDLKVKNRGISGDVTAGILFRLNEVVDRKPAKIFLLIGINDLARGIPIDTICSNIEKIIDIVRIKAPGTSLFIQSVLPVNDAIGGRFKSHVNKSGDIISVNNRLLRMAEDHGLSYVDLYTNFVNSAGKLDTIYTNDGLHINGAGYQLWKSMVFDLVYE